jgi:maleate cis-trans isomerase
MSVIDSNANDGFLIAGGNFPTLASIASWERKFGKPIITTNQAAIWAIMHAFGESKLPGFGRLLDRTG